MESGSARSEDVQCDIPCLVECLDRAVALGDPDRVTARIKSDLESLVRDGRIALPERFRRCRPDAYARRLLHRDPQHRYTAVVMTWGPGQGTCLHDHNGLWCVECVIAGEMEVAQYELVDRERDLYRFERQRVLRAGVGQAGSLVPPFEYHVLANPHDSELAMTLHVYQGEMSRCHLFERVDGSLYRRVDKVLAYDD